MPQLFLGGPSDMNVARVAGAGRAVVELVVGACCCSLRSCLRLPCNLQAPPNSAAACPTPDGPLPAEVLGFALPQFVSGRAHRALRRVAASRPLAARLRLREGHILQPLAGLLLALWRAERLQEAEAAEAAEEGQAAEAAAALPRHSFLRALDRQGALSDEVLRGLMAFEVRRGCWLVLR